MKMCLLDEDKICNNCRECLKCDLDNSKICDNCGQCIEVSSDYKEIWIDEILKEKDYSKNNI